MNLQPKITEFEGDVFKSKNEAKFAVCLRHSEIVSYRYEPFKINDYTPDFIITDLEGNKYVIEIKPCEVSESEMNRLKDISNHMKINKNFKDMEFVLVVANFYASYFKIINITNNQKDMNFLHEIINKNKSLANNHRFDLKEDIQVFETHTPKNNCNVINYKGIEIFVEQITPEIAEKYLKQNIKNRNISRDKVKFYEKEFNLNKWTFNGDTIRFSKQKILIDGQHRLTACVKTGIPFDALIVKNLPDDCFQTIDIGRKRTGSDTLTVLGQKNSKVLSASLSLVDYFMKGEYAKITNKHHNTEMPILLEKYPNIQESVSKYKDGIPGILPGSILSAMHYIFKNTDEQKADLFCDSVKDGIELSQGHPALALRNWLQKAANTRNTNLTKQAKISGLISAWNNYKQNKTIRFIKFNESNSFPKVL